MSLPRVLGIEPVGVIEDLPEGESDDRLAQCRRVDTLRGGMGRVFEGGCAAYVVVARRQVIPFDASLPWAVLSAVPETLQTAYGSLAIGLDRQPGQTLLIRGGTSALGLAPATLAKDCGASVLATTLQPERAAALRAQVVDHVIIDDGAVARGTRHRPRRRGRPAGTGGHAVRPLDGWTSSAPSTTSRAASGSRPTPAVPMTCRRRCCRRISTVRLRATWPSAAAHPHAGRHRPGSRGPRTQSRVRQAGGRDRPRRPRLHRAAIGP